MEFRIESEVRFAKATPCLVDTADMAPRQHLLRSHGKSYHCSTCWRAFSARLDEGRCPGAQCQGRAQPDKHWLTDKQVRDLEMEKIPNNPSGWYRLAAILFPDMPNRVYTPCTLPQPLASNRLTAANCADLDYSMWSHVPDAPTPGPSSPQNADAGSHPVLGSPTTTAPGFTQQDMSAASGAVSCSTLMGDSSAFDTDDIETSFWRTFEAEDIVPGMLDLDMIAVEPAPDERPSITTSSSPDDTQAGTTYARSNDTEATSATGPTYFGYPSCSCESAGTCGHCRLKQRAARLEKENESLRGAVERARVAVNSHDKLLQDMHDGCRAPELVMSDLWVYQDELRKALLPR